MRTLLHFLAWVFGALAVILLAAAGAVYALSSHRLSRPYTVATAAVPVPTSADAIQRGQHVAVVRGCYSCHGADLGGAKVIDDPAMGRIYGPNLTTGRGGLAAGLKNEDWVRAVREGIASDGRPLFLMPSKDFAQLSDEDLGDLLASIQAAAPVDRATPPLSVGPVSRVLLVLGKMRLSADVIDHTRARPAAHIAVEISPAYGRYLASSCSGCHNPRFSGGKIAEGPPNWPLAANLTPGPGSAVKGWSEADFIRTIRTGKAPNASEVNPIMPREIGQYSDLELKALWSYLQTLPPAATGS